MYDIIRLTTKCNQNCVFCFNKNMEDYCLTLDEARGAINELSKIQKKTIIFSGGEPTLRKEIRELISYSRECGFGVIGIQTNGTPLHDIQYLKRLAKGGLNYIYFSLHSDKEDISNEITGMKNGFDKTIKGIKNALLLNIDVELNHVINTKNYEGLLDYVKYINTLSDKIKIEFSSMIPLRDKKINQKLLPKFSQVEPFLKRALDYCIDNKIEFKLR